MDEINEIRMSGTVEMLRNIPTKSGTAMASFLLCQKKDKFKVVAFKNIAEAIFRAGDGSNVIVSGSAGINSWKDKDDKWRNDFQLSAWTVEISGQQIAYAKSGGESNTPQQEEPPFEPNAYKGGPF